MLRVGDVHQGEKGEERLRKTPDLDLDIKGTEMEINQRRGK